MKTTFRLILIAVLVIFLFALLTFTKTILTPSQTPSEQVSLGLHYGANQTTEFFDEAYKNVSKGKPNEKISAITVNHHLIAPNLVAQEMSFVATDKPITVVLLSPNHFFRGDGGAITSLFDWYTPYGDLKNNQELTKKLQTTGLVNIDETPFEQEHGINNIVGFIKKSLPNATFVPLIIKDNFPIQSVDALAAKFRDLLPPDSLIVASFDFSHYLTSNGADFHDQQTLSAIGNFDFDRIEKLDVDSHRALRLLMQYLDSVGAKKFTLTIDTNSSKVTNNFTFIETTSYINGYFTSGSTSPNRIKTNLYSPGTSSDRLFLYNDELLNAPKPLDFLDVTKLKDIAIGYVWDADKLTDVYLLPLDMTAEPLKLLDPLKADKLLLQVADTYSDPQLRNQILTGHIRPK